MKRLVICADDFGQSHPIDVGILELVLARRVTAVSAMSTAPAFRADLSALLETGVDVGLHVDLTEGGGGHTPSSLGAIIARSHLGVLSRGATADAIARQLDAFQAAAGRPPAFVDGHRHVHQLPVIRDLLLDELVRRFPSAPPAVRITVPRRPRGAKAALIAALGGRAIRRALDARAIPHNSDFAGVYGFDASRPYRERAVEWLADLEDGGLLMCHPGEDGGDVIAAARTRELAYLRSGEFEEDCASSAVSRVAFRALAESRAR